MSDKQKTQPPYLREVPSKVTLEPRWRAVRVPHSSQEWNVPGKKKKKTANTKVLRWERAWHVCGMPEEVKAGIRVRQVKGLG